MCPSMAYLSGAPRVSTDPKAELGGARTHVLGLMKGLESLGWDIQPYIVGDKVPRSWLRPGAERKLRSGRLSRLAADLIRIAIGSAGPRLAWRQLGDRVDVAYERMGAFQAWGRVFQERGTPWVLEVNAPLSYESTVERESILLPGLARRIEYGAYQSCDGIVTVSQALKRLLMELVEIPGGKIAVIPSAVDTNFFDPEKVKPKRVFSGPTLVYVGWLVPWQGVGLLLEAMHSSANEGASWSLVVVGDGPSRRTWERCADELGLSGSVRFVGHVEAPEVRRYIAGADLGFVGPTRAQIGTMYHSPLKLYEYMAMGKPLVAARYDDVRRAVEEGKTGFTFEPESTEALAEALVRAYKAEETWLTMGRLARAEVLKNHSWVDRAKRTTEFIQGLM